MRPLLTLLTLAMLLTAAASPEALAHKIKVFATVQGVTITGTVYFPGGGRAAGAEVTASAPDGTALTSAVTDADGAFTMEATRRVDHLLEVDTGDGHRATFRITAAQLPPNLPGDATAAAPSPGTAATAAGQAAPPADTTALPVASSAEFEALVARAVAAQVNPLREQIAAYEDRLRLNDLLGGLGWIAGLTGVGFFFLGRRDKRRGG